MIIQKVFPNKYFTICNIMVLGILLLYSWIKSATPPSPIESIIFWPGSYFLSLWLLSHGILYYYQTSPTQSHKQFLIRHGVGSVFFGLFHFLLTGLLILLLERFFRFPEHYTFATIGDYVRTSWHYITDGIIWYWAYIAVIQLFYFRRRLQQEKRKMADMQNDLISSDLNTLNIELNPHFLFNAMNSIAMKVRLGENKLAVSMIASLNDLLRTMLYGEKVKTILLSEELELLNKYLMIEKARFGDHLQIDQQFPEDLLRAQVPRMILQPLVENAFKHGVSENMSRQHIRISGQQENQSLILTVFNTTASKSWILTDGKSKGIGLPNIIRRLRGLYGTAFRFQSHYLEDGISFRITIPFMTT